VLQIKLEVVSKPGVLFFDCNATRRDAIQSCSPDVVRFDIVKAANQFGVAAELQRFYQAEILVPSPIPPHLIVFPDDAKSSGREKPKPKLPKTANAEFCKTRRSSMCSSSTSQSSSTTSSTASIVSLAEGEAATSLVLQNNVISVLGGKGEKLLADQAGDNECTSPAANKSASCARDDPARKAAALRKDRGGTRCEFQSCRKSRAGFIPCCKSSRCRKHIDASYICNCDTAVTARILA
jgi:hypothetical protein